VRRGPKVLPVRKVSLVSRGRLVRRDPQDPLDRQVKQVCKVLLVHRDRRALRVFKARQDPRG